MRGPERLLRDEDRWVSDVGGFILGERVVYRDKDLFRDLAGMRWMGLFLYGITGRSFSENQIRLMEGLWLLAISYPDPRIWINRVAALAGTVRSTTTLGVCGPLVIGEATIYGHRASIGAIDFLLSTRKKLDEGADLEELVGNELKKHRFVFGFGRPQTSQDERIEPILKLAKSLAISEGPHVQLAFEVERILHKSRRRLKLNGAGIAAALCADQGLSTREYAYFVVPGFLAGVVPCQLDAANKSEGTFFPIRCSRLDYEGPAPRRWEQ